MPVRPAKDDPIDSMAGISESPEELPRKTRYGRIIIRKGDLPGEDQVPKDRRKKVIRNEPIKAKRKYTKRKECPRASNEKEDTVATGKKNSTAKEKRVEEASKDRMEEEGDEMGEESDGEEYETQRGSWHTSEKTVKDNSPKDTNKNKNSVEEELKQEECNICGMVMEKYKMELHKLENHPQYGRYECLSCRIRTFFDYWELKAHYKVCSDKRIAYEGHHETAIYSQVIEAAFIRKIYQPVECPFCRVYLGTFFDLDVHFTSHGLATMDSKFACDGCKQTFISVDALKKHLTMQNTPRQSNTCFNTGRVLNRREIEKMKRRYAEVDRKDCIRNFNHDTYVLAPPKIFECAQECTCAYCDERTKTYALIKTDLSNLAVYGLECNEETKKEIVEKIKHSTEKTNDRVTICRHHFKWRNWTAKIIEGEEWTELVQTVLKRNTEQEEEEEERVRQRENEHGMAVLRELRAPSTAPSFIDDRFFSDSDTTVKEETEDEMMLNESYVKEEEEEEEDMCLDDTNSREMSEEEGMEMHFDVIDISDEEYSQGRGDIERGKGSLPPLMDKRRLEEKVSASMRMTCKCPVCESLFPTLNDLHTHGDAHPETRLLYLCADCPDKSFYNPEDVFKHFDDKMKSALAAFYSFKVIVQTEGKEKD